MASGYDIDTIGCPRDANGWIMADRGRQPLTDVWTLGTAFKDIRLAKDCKEISFIVRSGTLTFRGTEPGGVAFADASAVVDPGGGLVNLPFTGHGFTIGDPVVIVGTTNYDDTHTLQAGTTADVLQITATYVAETLTALMYAEGYRDRQYAALASDVLPVVVEAREVVIKAKGTCVVDVTYWR
jgi:hypothetical protein